MTALVMLILFSIIIVSICVNVYLLKSRRKTSAKEISSVLMQGIQEVNDLATIRQSFQSIVTYEDSRLLFGFRLPGTHKKFLLKYSGNIVVGTDLSKVVITQFVSGKVQLKLPHSRVLDTVADIKNIQVYDQHSGIFNPLSFDEQNSAITANLLEIEAEALAGDLLARSDENAKNILTSLCRSIGVEVEVEFIDEPALPETFSGVLPEMQPEVSAVSEKPFVCEVTSDR